MASTFEEEFTARVRVLLHERWLVSGFGRAEPPPPTLRVARLENGALRVTVLPAESWSFLFPWDGSESQLENWLETVAEDIWGDSMEREYPNWRPPR